VVRNFGPRTLYGDILARDASELAKRAIYVAGFPCKAFSSLRHETLWMEDPEAKQFYKVTSAIKESQPRLAILENVKGLKKVIRKVMQHLRECGQYRILLLEIDVKDLGVDVSRPRIFIIMLHKTIVNPGDTEELLCQRSQEMLADVVSHFGRTQKRAWEDLLFDEASSPVKRWRLSHNSEATECNCHGCGGESSTGATASMSTKPSKRVACQWKHTHWDYMTKHDLDPRAVNGFSKRSTRDHPTSVSSPRYRHCLDIALFKAKKDKATCRAIDLSQRPCQARGSFDDQPLTTITPGCKLYVPKFQRTLCAEEKALLMGMNLATLDTSVVSSGQHRP
jgi:site-specific DNA-cytosine methylase